MNSKLAIAYEPNETDDVTAESVTVQASLKWFNNFKGFGFVVPDGGDYDAFIHISKLIEAEVKAIGPGAILKCTIQRCTKGAQVIKIEEVISNGDKPEPLRFQKGANENQVKVTGHIKWYKKDKGFGFIVADDGEKDIFIHKTRLEEAGISDLPAGTPVSVIAVPAPKGREAIAFEILTPNYSS